MYLLRTFVVLVLLVAAFGCKGYHKLSEKYSINFSPSTPQYSYNEVFFEFIHYENEEGLLGRARHCLVDDWMKFTLVSSDYLTGNHIDIDINIISKDVEVNYSELSDIDDGIENIEVTNAIINFNKELIATEYMYGEVVLDLSIKYRKDYQYADSNPERRMFFGKFRSSGLGNCD